MTPHEEELRIRLRAAADEHQPDREAMLARIERRRAETGRRADRRPIVGGLRPLVTAGALAAVITLGASGAWLFVRSDSTQTDTASAPLPPPVTAAAPTNPATESESATTAPTPSAASPTPRSTSPRPPEPTRTPRTSPTAPSIPEGDAPVRGWLWSNGSMDPNSNANWAQSTVTLKNTSEITALEVTIRVALTSGVTTTGNWSSVPNDKLDITVREDSSWLYYRFRLRDGATMAPGSYTFAGQYNHRDRTTTKDAYLASASAGRQDVEVHGGF